jgi:hypothetical protein
MNIEQMKMKALEWFRRGSGHTRTWEEVQAYLEGVEDATLVAYESMGRTSMAVYEANSTFSELDEYLEGMISNNVPS